MPRIALWIASLRIQKGGASRASVAPPRTITGKRLPAGSSASSGGPTSSAAPLPSALSTPEPCAASAVATGPSPVSSRRTRRNSVRPLTLRAGAARIAGPTGRGGGGERVGVGVDDLARPRRLIHLDQLGARGQDRDPRAAVDGERRAADRGEHSQVRGADRRPGSNHHLPGPDVLARGAHVRAGRGGRAPHDRAGALLSVLHPCDGVL